MDRIKSLFDVTRDCENKYEITRSYSYLKFSMEIFKYVLWKQNLYSQFLILNQTSLNSALSAPSFENLRSSSGSEPFYRLFRLLFRTSPEQ